MFSHRAAKLKLIRENFIKYMDSSQYMDIENGTLKSYQRIAKECANSSLQHHKIRSLMAALYPDVAERMSLRGRMAATRKAKLAAAIEADAQQAVTDKAKAEEARLNSLVSVSQLEQVLKGVRGITLLPLIPPPTPTPDEDIDRGALEEDAYTTQYK